MCRKVRKPSRPAALYNLAWIIFYIHDFFLSCLTTVVAYESKIILAV